MLKLEGSVIAQQAELLGLGLHPTFTSYTVQRSEGIMSFSPIHSRSPGRRITSPTGGEDDRSNINTIFVGNLAPESDERSLREFFGKYGYVAQVKVQNAAAVLGHV